MEENKQKLEEFLKQYPDVAIIEETSDLLRVKLTNKINAISLEDFINGIFKIEADLAENKENHIALDLKDLDIQNLEKIIKLALKNENLADPLIILNILNLIKVYNTLNQAFFDSPNVYVSNTSDLLDIRLDLQEELEEFVQKVSIYFLSLFKSYNKTTYTPTDIHQKLPRVYKTIFLTTDSLTLSGIFASSKPFSTAECVYLDDAIECIYALKEKSSLEFSLISNLIGMKTCQ